MENSYAILLLAGIVLFITLIGLLWKGKLTGKAGAPLFLLAIIMMAYRTVKEFVIGPDGISIETYATAVAADPQNQKNVDLLDEALKDPAAVSQLQKDPVALNKTVHALSAVASFKVISNDVQAARNYIERARVLDSNSAEVKFVQEHLSTTQTGQKPYQKTVAIGALKTRYGLK